MLLGEADAKRFRVSNDLGEPDDPARAIVPILRQEHTGRFAVVGTGFFIAERGILATAKHVIADVFDRHGRPEKAIGIMQFTEWNTYLLRSVTLAVHHEFADVAVAILAAATHNVTKLPASNGILRLTATAPPLGSRVFTFGYPKGQVTGEKPQVITLAGRYFEGELVEWLPDGRDSVLLPGPCFRTSMVLHGGASGGPVIGPDGRVFAINSTGIIDDKVSYVSCIRPLFDLALPNIQLPGATAPRAVTVRELGQIGHVDIGSK